MPLVRVVIPTYKRAGLVAEAIASVQRQSFQEFEIVVADDGSPDETRAVVEELALRDKRIIYLGLPHAGAAKARNAGISLPGSHAYVAFLDADDLWLPHHLGDSIQVLRDNPSVAVAFSSVEIVDVSRTWNPDQLRERHERVRRPSGYATRTPAPGFHLLEGDAMWRGLLQGEFTPVTSTTVVRRGAVHREHWFDAGLEIFEDCELFLWLARGGVTFAFFDDPHVQYRCHGDNLTGVDLDLSSPVFRRRQQSVLRFAKAKLGMCSAAEDRKIAASEVARAAYLLGQSCAEQADLPGARRCYLDSFRSRPTLAALKGYALSCVPAPLYGGMRGWKRRSAA